MFVRIDPPKEVITRPRRTMASLGLPLTGREDHLTARSRRTMAARPLVQLLRRCTLLLTLCNGRTSAPSYPPTSTPGPSTFTPSYCPTAVPTACPTSSPTSSPSARTSVSRIGEENRHAVAGDAHDAALAGADGGADRRADVRADVRALAGAVFRADEPPLWPPLWIARPHRVSDERANGRPDERADGLPVVLSDLVPVVRADERADGVPVLLPERDADVHALWVSNLGAHGLERAVGSAVVGPHGSADADPHAPAVGRADERPVNRADVGPDGSALLGADVRAVARADRRPRRRPRRRGASAPLAAAEPSASRRPTTSSREEVLASSIEGLPLCSYQQTASFASRGGRARDDTVRRGRAGS